MALRGIIFDFDGTLADTFGVYDSAFGSVTRRFLGREVPYEERIKIRGADEIDFVRNLVPHASDKAAEVFVSEFREAHLECVDLHPGIRPLLDDLSTARMRLGMISAKAHESAEIAFELISVRHYFDPIITGTGWAGGKAPGISSTVELWGMRPEEVAYIGDSVGDIQDALLAGVLPLGAAWAGISFPISTVVQLSDAGAAEVFTDPMHLAEWATSQDV